jgi:hypothetical protein
MDGRENPIGLEKRTDCQNTKKGNVMYEAAY